MWELNLKEGWNPKNKSFQIVVLEKTLESPLDARKSNQSISIQPIIGKTDAKVEAPILWPADAKDQHFGEDPDAEKDWGQEEKRVAEDEMIE